MVRLLSLFLTTVGGNQTSYAKRYHSALRVDERTTILSLQYGHFHFTGFSLENYQSRCLLNATGRLGTYRYAVVKTIVQYLLYYLKRIFSKSLRLASNCKKYSLPALYNNEA